MAPAGTNSCHEFYNKQASVYDCTHLIQLFYSVYYIKVGCEWLLPDAGQLWGYPPTPPCSAKSHVTLRSETRVGAPPATVAQVAPLPV